MTEPQPVAAPPSKSRKKLFVGLSAAGIVIIIIVVILASLGSVFVYQTVQQAAQQPNIQATAISIPAGTTNPRSSKALNEGRVSSSGTFDYAVTQPGTYALTFDNTFSTFSSKSVSVSYTATGYQGDSRSFTVDAGTTQSITFNLKAGDRISGSFSVAGGSGNDVDFYVTADTCTHTVNFSFTLVNSGSANGYATVQFQVDGQSYWTNRFFVSPGQQLTETGSVVLPDCGSHTYNVVVSSIEKG